MPITVRHNPKQPKTDRTLASRITEWATSTVIGIAVAIIGAAIGFFDHPIVVAICVSLGNITIQCVEAIISHRRKKKAGITGYAQGGHIR